MDLNIPKISGLEVTSTIRKFEDPYFRDVPVVAITSSFADEVVNEIKAHQLNGFVSKPINPSDIEQTLRGYLTSTWEKEEETPKVVASPKEKRIDFSKLNKLSNGNAAQVVDIIKTIASTIPTELDRIKRSISFNDFSTVRISAHKLKPNYEYIGLQDLSSLSGQIEREAEKKNTEIIIPLVKKLEAESLLILPELENISI